MNHNTAAGQYEFTLDTFVDDVEAALGAEAERKGLTGITAASINLVTEEEHPLTDSLLVHYLRESFSLSCTSNQPLRIEYLGKEAAEDPYALFIYFRIKEVCTDSDQGLSLTNVYMHDRYDDQQNIVVWQRDGTLEASDLLTRHKPTVARRL